MNEVIAHCEHCSTRFEVPARSVGGVVNCISCGLATEVPGGTDVEWLVLCAVAALLTAVVTVVAYMTGGFDAAVLALGICAAICLVVRLSS